MKQQLREWFVQALGDLDVGRAMASYAARCRHLRPDRQPALVIAFGKAARPMASALAAELADTDLHGLVVPPEPDDAPLPPFPVIAGGHPLPTAGSLEAARRALELACTVGPDEEIFFLVSGGGSAMLELPADPAVTLDELREFYRALVGSGADIVAINTVRRWLSAVKGGRLALAAAAAKFQHTVAISDVPDGDDVSLASIPTRCDRSTLADCRAVLDRHALWPAMPAALRRRVEQGRLQDPLRPNHPLVARSDHCLLMSNREARAALRSRAEQAGVLIVEDQSVDDLPYDIAAARLLTRLDALHGERPGRTVGVLTGGEVTVRLPGTAGNGGRNQQFALECARRIAGQPITVLSAGTDGVDGSSPAAGAVVDGTTAARARGLGFDVTDALRRHDAYPLLSAIGDAIVTGPTGQNVRDLRLLVQTA